QSNDQAKVLQLRIDSLESKLAAAYKPGFGEFMGNIQIHHNKLWFAGLSKNWKLADFEIKEIKETVEAIETYQTEREESQQIAMIKPMLDSVETSIQKNDLAQFKQSFISLTTNCNNCHQATHFEFNVVKIPDHPPFSNQEFFIQSTK
ncbi:MAG TPA: hypothetical protein PK931_08305, partial [Saprospiraceae bacterium]|nr:hypothetical protein [Saprospiraceae bacterium]